MQGLISDFLGKRAPVLCISLLLAMGSLVGYSRESVISIYFLIATSLFLTSLIFFFFFF